MMNLLLHDRREVRVEGGDIRLQRHGDLDEGVLFPVSFALKEYRYQQARVGALVKEGELGPSSPSRHEPGDEDRRVAKTG